MCIRESGVLIDGLGEGLLIGDLRRTDVRLDLELAEQTVDDDLQMELAHTCLLYTSVSESGSTGSGSTCQPREFR